MDTQNIIPTERPILFSAPMVRAILDGRKTQTRRAVKGNPINMVRLMHKTQAMDGYDEPTGEFGFCPSPRVISKHVRCPYGQAGDTLWVRETWSAPYRYSDMKPRDCGGPCWYWADGDPSEGDWTKPTVSIHMPRWASRISLRVTGVRCERLQDIGEEDAKAEGTQEPSLVPYIGACWSERDAFARLWESINGNGSWAKNPWVWVISFVPEVKA